MSSYTGSNCHPPASACQMLGSQACNTTLGSMLGLFLLFLKLKKKIGRRRERGREGEEAVERDARHTHVEVRGQL